MKVKLQVSRAGIGFSQNAGDVVSVDAAEAGRLIAAGQAVAVDGVESAAVDLASERAVKSTPKPRRRRAVKNVKQRDDSQDG